MLRTLFFLFSAAMIAAPIAWALADDFEGQLHDESAIQQALTRPDPSFERPKCLVRIFKSSEHQELMEAGYRVSEISREAVSDIQGRRYYRVALTYTMDEGGSAPVYTAVRCMAR
jgi:hypothetical protein